MKRERNKIITYKNNSLEVLGIDPPVILFRLQKDCRWKQYYVNVPSKGKIKVQHLQHK